MMLAVLEVRLKELLPFLTGDAVELDDGAGDEEAKAEDFRCFF